jgi:hypothetical protein
MCTLMSGSCALHRAEDMQFVIDTTHALGWNMHNSCILETCFSCTDT